MNLVNLTPHTINVHLDDGTITKIPVAAMVARVSEVSRKIDSINNIPIYAVWFGEVVGLPEPEENTYYIVSQMVKAAAKNRFDLFSPYDMVRDASGNIIGCRGFC